MNLDGIGAGGFEDAIGSSNRHKGLGILFTLFVLDLLAIDGLPSWIGENLALALERLPLHARDAGGDIEAGGWVENSDKALRDHLEELGLDLIESGRRGTGRDNGVVIGYLGVVEDFAGLDHPIILECRLGVPAQLLVLEGLKGCFHSRHSILGKVAGIGARIGQHLVVLVETLSQLKGPFGAEAEATIGLSLERGQIVEQRRGLGGRLLGLFDDTRFANTLVSDLLGARFLPEALGFFISRIAILVGFLKALVKPAAGIAASGHPELGMDLEIGLRDEGADLLFTLDQNSQGRGLDATHRRELETSLAGVHRSQRTSAVDADQPVALRAADGRRRQRLHLGIVTEMGKPLLDRSLRHRLEPEALDGLLAAGELDDVVKNELSLAARIAGVDDGGYLGLLEQSLHDGQSVGGAGNRLELELLGNDRQLLETPGEALAPGHLVRKAELD